MSLHFADIKALWDCLSGIHGLDEMRCLGEMGHECVRETLMQFSDVFAGDPGALESLKDMVQMLTVFYNMTGAAVMKVEVTEGNCWVDKNRIFPAPRSPPMGETRHEIFSIFACKDMSLNIVNLQTSRKELEALQSEIPEEFVAAKACVAKSQVLIKDLMFLADPWDVMC